MWMTLVQALERFRRLALRSSSLAAPHRSAGRAPVVFFCLLADCHRFTLLWRQTSIMEENNKEPPRRVGEIGENPEKS